MKKNKILFIEDDEFLLKMYGMKLNEMGFDVTVWKGVTDDNWIDKVTEINPDLISTGILMPKPDGFEVIKALKDDPSTRDIPIFGLDNLSQLEDSNRVISSGAVNYLRNTDATPNEVAKIFTEYLNKHKSGPQGNNGSGIKTEHISIDQIQIGEIKHPNLSQDLINRIKNFKSILFQVETTTIDQTIDNFKRDTHPEKQILGWEAIANVYKDLVFRLESPPLEFKKEVYKTLLVALGEPLSQSFLASLKILQPDVALTLQTALNQELRTKIGQPRQPIVISKKL